MNPTDKKCTQCGGTSFARGSDYINIRPLDKKFTIGSEKIYTFCLDCGEVLSIKISNPSKLNFQHL
ncbi:hypothetical protein [Cytobacillus horneckiae]|uniref:Transcription initiation factor TFIIIB n=1 Tax=Cytobacillus horneckiae TaxID=549687 RepID=A0A2N0ZBS3_9BACI|nr:hypothetical protein [Cytobacillus horneckiae]MEC1155688.1 hypothetical protein [Cytobacillus horneckiae]MED2940391.1 hypothetical protein [Cytobacillus horneckiae]PKG26972.1 hypothetical protein CWS20_21235 [Cytobacillus horneckiae]